MPAKLSGGSGNFWYSFNRGPVHYISLSTEHSYDIGSPQYSWLVSDLQRATNPTNRSLRPWVILMGHRPMYCSDTFEAGDCGVGAHIVQVLEPLMQQYKVDFYVAGHHHTYERTVRGIS